jgi:hypothetical protein
MGFLDCSSLEVTEAIWLGKSDEKNSRVAFWAVASLSVMLETFNSPEKLVSAISDQKINIKVGSQ